MTPELMPIYGIIGLYVLKELGSGVAGGVRWFAGRTVAKGDAEKAEMLARIDDLEAQVNTLLPKFDTVLHDLGTMSGTVNEIRKGLEENREKQGAYYRELLKEHATVVQRQIADAEQQLRRDMTRAVDDVRRLKAKAK